MIDKLKEPSTWAGFGLIATALGWNVASWDALVQVLTAVAGLLAVLLRERRDGTRRND